MEYVCPTVCNWQLTVTFFSIAVAFGLTGLVYFRKQFSNQFLLSLLTFVILTLVIMPSWFFTYDPCASGCSSPGIYLSFIR